MTGNRYSDEIRRKAVLLHKSGKPYSEISKMLGVLSKGTLSYWLHDITGYKKDSQKQKDHLARIRPIAQASIQKRIELQNIRIDGRVSEIVSKLPGDSIPLMKALLAMLYWAEGSKTNSGTLKFANTDPEMHKLFISLLRKCYPVRENNFKVALYLHYYHDIQETTEYWSQLLGINKEAFYKSYIKRKHETKRFRKNFAGICYLYYGDNEIFKEVLALGKKIGVRFTAKP